MKVDLKITGLKEFANACRRVPQRVGQRIIRNDTRQSANAIKESFAVKAPVQTGLMRETAQVKLERGNDAHVAAFQIGTGAWYIHLLEFGTERIAPRHDLEEAFDETAPREVNRLSKSIIGKVLKAVTIRRSVR